MTLNEIDTAYEQRRKQIESENIMCRCDCTKREAIHTYKIEPVGGILGSIDAHTVANTTHWKDCQGSQCCGPFNTTYYWWDCYSSAEQGGKFTGDMRYG
jgi:hypothetical protein